ncbi:hypothetical protein H257_17324 [Aphanomyces astaci]|uniref:Uncharacterized protein n=1 Tax=Aphanomyces astaci TaxID=112090 RepID=W4FF90_APHAT|nr:hypothetical protein H257_17324 [Aphanomyces astaci]ETV66172.1 hypothetical protein H257_17324 [Aphanomyces astaci]|eukprot:XP_009844361.1 hypothetical protein H257_17324 [Aphanomyces astaci]
MATNSKLSGVSQFGLTSLAPTATQHHLSEGCDYSSAARFQRPLVDCIEHLATWPCDGACADVKSRMTNCGRTKSYTVSEIEQRIKATRLAQRQTYRALGAAIEVSTWTIWNFIQSKWVTRRSNWTKPRLKPE